MDLAEVAGHHVRRLQVPMDDSPRVSVSHRLAHLLEDRQEPRPIVDRTFAVFEQRGESSAADQLHRDVEPSVGEAAEFMDRDDSRVLKLSADLRLLDKPADDLRSVAVFLQDHLDGQVPAKVDISPLEDHPHSATRDFTHQVISPRLTVRVRHLWRPRPDEPGIGRAIAKKHARDWSDRLVESHQDPRSPRIVGSCGRTKAAPVLVFRSQIVGSSGALVARPAQRIALA